MQATRRSQSQRRAATRASLLRAAATVFASRGYAAASLDEVARRARLSKGALTYHFPTKEALFLAVAEDRLGARARQVSGIPGSVQAASPAAATEMVAALPHDREWSLLFLEFVCHAARHRRFREPLRQLLDGARGQAAEAISEAGLAERPKARRVADATSAIANGMSIEALLDGDEERAAELFAFSLDLVLRGLRARAAGD